MKYYSTIDNITAIEWGLTVQQAVLFDWIYSLPSWADSMVLSDGKVVYFASRNKAITELPLLTDKPDTVYRYYKQLEDLGLITLVKFDKKDWIQLTEKSKEWGRASEYSEINPSKLGNKSEQTRKIIREHSDLNPTYNNTSRSDNKNKNTSDQLSMDIWPTFDDFWGAVIHKTGKAEARDYWNGKKKLKDGRKLSQKMKEQVMEHYPVYSKSNEPNYITRPHHYLYRLVFEDEIIDRNKKQFNGAPTDSGRSAITDLI